MPRRVPTKNTSSPRSRSSRATASPGITCPPVPPPASKKGPKRGPGVGGRGSGVGCSFIAAFAEHFSGRTTAFPKRLKTPEPMPLLSPKRNPSEKQFPIEFRPPQAKLAPLKDDSDTRSEERRVGKSVDLDGRR